MAKLFADSDRTTTETAIRDLFRELGGNLPIRELAIEVIDRGVLTTDELDRIRLRGVMDLCRHALSHITADGVPYAQPIRNGKRAPWVQLDLYTPDQFGSLLGRRAVGIADDCGKWWDLYTWGCQRFARGFQVPAFIQRWRDDFVNDDGDVDYRYHEPEDDES
jgi:hypothetical protein